MDRINGCVRRHPRHYGLPSVSVVRVYGQDAADADRNLSYTAGDPGRARILVVSVQRCPGEREGVAGGGGVLFWGKK